MITIDLGDGHTPTEVTSFRWKEVRSSTDDPKSIKPGELVITRNPDAYSVILHGYVAEGRFFEKIVLNFTFKDGAKKNNLTCDNARLAAIQVSGDGSYASESVTVFCESFETEFAPHDPIFLTPAQFGWDISKTTRWK